MPRREIPFLPDHYYHLYNRGNNHQKIFFEQSNYLYFLRGLKRYVSPVATVISYCLMPTHYHLVLKIKEPRTSEKISQALTPLSRAMKNFSISYTKGINKRYSRVGTLFQCAFKSKSIGTYKYLLNLCIYVHANPVKDGLVAEISNWPYSNYLEWLGERNEALMDRQFILDHFETSSEYKGLMFEYLKTRDLPDDIRRYLQSLEV